MQVCGLWPLVVTAQSPMTGVPLGLNLQTGEPVCCDPINLFQRAHLISNPSCFILGLPGLGKSTTIRRMLWGLHAQGVMPLVLGDLKGEYIDLVRQIGGQVIQLGPGGRGYLNVLDPGNGLEAVKLLMKNNYHKQAQEMLADIRMRQLNLITGLISISRKGMVSDRETNIISKALQYLNDQSLNSGTIPILKDFLKLVQYPTPAMRDVAYDQGSQSKYNRIVENLIVTLKGLVEGNELGEIFSQQTSEPMRLDKPVCFDVSSIPDTQLDLQAAALLACWSEGFANINISHTLADYGLAPRGRFIVALDELWRALRSAGGMVDRVDALTRLNRSYGTGMIMATHTVADLEALPNVDDRAKAKGFIQRSGIVIMAGLPHEEIELLRQVISITKAEEKEVTSWSTPPGLNTIDVPPGVGKIMIKLGERPGILVKVQLVPVEATVNDTNKRWH
jgi:type IV secretory pathway VirB4 component